MKTLFLSVSLVLLSMVTYAQKTDKQIKKELKAKPEKLARKEAKKLRKAGWEVGPGSLPMEKMLDKKFKKEYEETDKGNAKYISAEGNAVGETKTAAEIQALTVAKLNLASVIESKVNGLLSGNIANQQLNNEDAASITQVLANSKELISADLGYVEPVVKLYRTPKGNDKNTEVQLVVFYDTEQSMQIAKKIIKKELKDKLKVNEEQLNKMMGID
jgi:hypothetical protein